MSALGTLAWAIALVLFSAGGVLLAGGIARGRRFIYAAIALVALVPLFLAGLRQLLDVEVPYGSSVAYVLGAVAVLALLGSIRSRRTEKPTSQKRRIERGPSP